MAVEISQEKRDRWWHYLYYKIDWKHATAMKKMRFDERGRATKASDDFVKIVNYINENNVRWIKL